MKADPAFKPKAPAKKRKQVDRRPMHQAQWQLRTANLLKPVPLSQLSDPILQLHIGEHGAETVSAITAPIEPMPRERISACVHIMACLLESDDERSRIYVEHLCAVDLDKHDEPLCGPRRLHCIFLLQPPSLLGATGQCLSVHAPARPPRPPPLLPPRSARRRSRSMYARSGVTVGGVICKRHLHC